MMERGLDHLVYATPDLDASISAVAVLFGTEPVPGGAHPGWGTRNALIGLGTGAYLEIIGPDPAQPDPEGARPFLIDGLTDARLVTWAYRHPDLESTRDLLEHALQHAYGNRSLHGDPGGRPGTEVRLGPVRTMSRARPDGDTLHWRLSDPMALPVGGVIPFLIDWGSTRHPSLALPKECQLLELTLGHPDADALRPVVDSFRPLIGEPDGAAAKVSGLSIVSRPEPGMIARIQTPNGKIDLS